MSPTPLILTIMAKLLYFGSLPDRLNIAAEDIDISQSVSTVQELLTSLRQRGKNWEQYLQEDKVQVTLNKKFAELESSVSDMDEIAIISIGLN